ncbi:MAG TPA: IS21-like element helper ATPase IstB [Candidatus Ozemobacteraceae bacterium]|nr:IS21-like element helper ATPase IstB [Candidatus Ozemobacteraceae bacterium]
MSNSLSELQALAHDLDLTTLAESLPAYLQKAEQGHPAYTDFVMGLLRTELHARRARRMERFLKRAKLGLVEELETFDFSIRPKLEPRIIKELCTCRFVDERRNVLCLGRPGLGKTRIAKIIARAACLAGYSVLFTNTAVMLEDLHGSFADGTYTRTLRRYTKPQLLICDEFGYEPFDSKATKYLFRLVSARHRQGSLIITSNTGFARWKTLFPSESAAVATVDRLVDQATILRFSGKGSRTPRDFHGDQLDDD